MQRFDSKAEKGGSKASSSQGAGADSNVHCKPIAGARQVVARQHKR
jgi:hypothetical protein